MASTPPPPAEGDSRFTVKGQSPVEVAVVPSGGESPEAITGVVAVKLAIANKALDEEVLGNLGDEALRELDDKSLGELLIINNYVIDPASEIVTQTVKKAHGALQGRAIFRLTAGDKDGFNDLRRNVGSFNPKLSDVNWRGMDLSDTILSVVDLSGADLSGADLSGADLHAVTLDGANLSGATLNDVKDLTPELLSKAGNLEGITVNSPELAQLVEDAADLVLESAEKAADEEAERIKIAADLTAKTAKKAADEEAELAKFTADLAAKTVKESVIIEK